MEHLSPEERLLQLIRRRPKKEAAPASPAAPATPLSAETIPSPKPRLKIHFPIEGEGEFLFLFKKMNRFLGIAFVLLAGLFLITFVGGKLAATHHTEKLPAQERGPVISKSASPEESSRKPYSYYASDVEKRNIFGPSLYTESRESPGVPALKESVKDLSLLGIISGKTPQAIIEDKKEGKTHIVNKGDAIGFLQVEEIMESKVILNYRGERIDLVL